MSDDGNIPGSILANTRRDVQENMQGENTGANSIWHSYRELAYRSPFGAVPEETEVLLAIDVYLQQAEVTLCYSYGLKSFSRHTMQMKKSPEHTNRFYVNIRMPGEYALFFYWFSIIYKTEAGEKQIFYVNAMSSLEASGKIVDSYTPSFSNEEPYDQAFQITVYKKNFHTPDWFKGALMYQIFPERFNRDSRYYPGRMQSVKNAPERIYHEDWYEDVDIDGTPETGYLACDFYGGSLDGIREKIPYLNELNIECLYLNPVFEARSNHHYDTADYLRVDAMLGGNEGFHAFANEMKANGIRFLLDGVFSHTGADSVYFNKLGRYSGQGAYQSYTEGVHSPYASWYTFTNNEYGEVKYDSWWGFTDLPNVQEDDLSFRNFIFGEKGIVRSWIKNGAAGWRLDVSDELPDSFLREMRKAVKAETNGEGVVLGEIWEDASRKVSYGSYRDFIFGNTHDSAMGYPFRQAVLDFFTGLSPAERLNATLESYRSNYPAEVYYCLMNLISSHDVPRAITVFSGVPDPGNRIEQKKIVLDQEQREKGYKLMRLAFIFQMTYIGSPCIYYGDEIGMEGYQDPFNRRTYPWDRLENNQKEQLDFYVKYSALRKKYPVLKTGDYKTVYSQGDVFVFKRFYDENGKDYFGKDGDGIRLIYIAINRSAVDSYFDETMNITLKPLSFYIKEE